MPTDLSRRRFLESLAAVAGASLLVGCGNKEEVAPGPPGAGGPPPPGAPAGPLAAAGPGGTFTVTDAGALKAGQAQAFSFPGGEPGIVFLTSDGKPGALSAKCTHKGCTVQWRPKTGKDALVCPCHDSVFEPNGVVLDGPAKTPLARYTVMVKGNDAVLTPA